MHRGISAVWYNPYISQGVFSETLGSQLPSSRIPKDFFEAEVGISNLDHWRGANKRANEVVVLAN